MRQLRQITETVVQKADLPKIYVNKYAKKACPGGLAECAGMPGWGRTKGEGVLVN